MRRSDLLYRWPLLTRVMRQRCLYVLGAGASRPDIPGDLRGALLRSIAHQGIYDGFAHEPSPLVARLLPWELQHEITAELSNTISANELVAHTPIDVIELYLARLLTRPNVLHVPQYEFFDWCVSSIIFNFNNDNLGNWIHPKHLSLRPHGSVDGNVVHSPWMTRALYHLAIPRGWAEGLGYHRPLPESNTITNTYPYEVLKASFSGLDAVVLIGYSFGTQEDGRLDDVESYDQIVDLLRWRPKPVLLIDPQPESIAARIEDTLRKHAVSMLACEWNVLTRFVFTGALRRALMGGGIDDSRIVTLQYRIFRDVFQEAVQR